MTSCMRYAFMGLVAAGLLAASAASDPARAGTLSVCVDTSSPAHSMDLKVAGAVARQLGDRLAVHRFDGRGGDEGFALKHFRSLLDHDCALVMGFPVDTGADAGTPPGTRATVAYGRTGFVLVTPRHGGASTLSGLARGSAVAVTYQTTPNLYFADHPHLQADVYLSDARAVAALRSGKVHAAMLWRPTVVSDLADAGARFAEHALDEPHANFNLVALYVDPAVARRFDAGVAALRREHRLQPLLEPYAEPAPATEPTLSLRARRADAWRRPRACADRRAAGSHRGRRLPTLFTRAQAAIGKTKFEDNCSQCHGPNLEGRAGPALKGPNFASEEADFHVGDIFTIVTHNMPATQPGSLQHDDYVQIMAFILSQNGYPSGADKLTYDEAMKSTVPLRYHGE